jgi:hypothetical protein
MPTIAEEVANAILDLRRPQEFLPNTSARQAVIDLMHLWRPLGTLGAKITDLVLLSDFAMFELTFQDDSHLTISLTSYDDPANTRYFIVIETEPRKALHRLMQERLQLLETLLHETEALRKAINKLRRHDENGRTAWQI